MVDKSIKNAYIWYSGATDKTGKNLAEALGTKHGNKKPAAGSVNMVIGWGAKTKKSVDLGKLPTLNHPDKIKINRNKLAALQLMSKAGVNVADFTENVEDISSTTKAINLPVIGRTRYHQGGKGFWNCPTMTHVQAALEEGASYFQNLIEIKDEYRLHVFGDKVIYAVKKVKRPIKEIEAAYIKHEMDRQKSLAAKNGDTLDEKTMEIFLRRQAKKFAQDGANMLIRSNRLGWKFARIKKVDKALETEAVKSLAAIGLNFGAVDCCTDVNGKVWVIEVNTGPGLENTPFEVWTKTFKETIENILQPKTIAQKITDKFVSKKKTTEKSSISKSGSIKQTLAHKVGMMQEMVEVADDDEAEVLNSVFKKMFG